MSRRGFPLAPPSPIPTGRGLRSSAINDEILSDFLISSLHVPDLKLPISAQPRRVVSSAVDFRSIASSDGESVECVLRRASQFGFFTISGHGILSTEIRAAKRGAEYGGGDLRDWEDEGFDFCWAGEEEEDRSEFIPDPRKVMEAIAVRLVAIGKSLGGLIFSTTTCATDFGATNLAILKSNVEYRLCEGEAPSNGEDKENNALGLYLPSSKCEVLVQVGSQSFVFEAGPDTIVAVLGRQFEVDIAGHVTSTPRKLRFVRAVEDARPATDPIVFSIELKLGSPRKQSSRRQSDTRISIIDQILVVGLIVLLFQLVLWIYKTV